MAQIGQLPDIKLDLRGTPCPLNFVRTKLQLDKMAAGQLLEVWLDGGEPIEQVPESLAIEGYAINAIEERTGFFALLIQKPQDTANATLSASA
ncbi:MAG TPA: sulfurtransferase TusA family protein [Halomicronema sp.]